MLFSGVMKVMKFRSEVNYRIHAYKTPLTVSCRMIYRYGAPSVLKESKQWHLLLLTTQMHIVLFSDKLLWEKTV